MKQKALLYVCLCLFAGIRSFAYGAEINGIYYNFYDSNAEVAANYSEKYSGNVVIPESVTYDGNIYRVTSIGSFAFSSCANLTSITIPNSVTTIGSYAFQSCTGLTSISLPNSLTSIGSGAFSDCSNLTSIIIPDYVTTIGNYTFYGCSGLISVTIGNGVTTIGDGAFYNCTSLNSLTIGNGVTTIGDDAFSGCTSLNSLTIPNSVTSIGNRAFYGCIIAKDSFINNSTLAYSDEWGLTIYDKKTEDGLMISGSTVIKCNASATSVTIPGDITTIGNSAFEGCLALSSVTIPESVTSIGDRAFWRCRGLTTITLPKNLSSIGSYAFYECTGLASMTIPQSVTSISENAFTECYFADGSFINNSALTSSGTWGATICDIETSDGLLIKDLYFVSVYKCRPWATSVIIPNNVEMIGTSAFENCTALTSVSIPESVTYMLNYVFQGCTSLTTVNIPKNISSIGYSAFQDCKSLASITIPEDVTEIGKYAFNGCSSLSSVVIESKKIKIDTSSFENCPNITSLSLNCEIIDNWFKGKELLTSLTLGNNVKELGSSAFSGCTGLTTVTIPNSVTSIGSSAFANCSSLTDINIPEGVTSIGSSAFTNCKGLTSINIPEGVKTVESHIFEGCSSLVSVTFPSNLNSIQSYAFADCSLTSATIPQNVTFIGGYAFSGCKLTSITIPKSVTDISDRNPFSGCSELTSIKVENGNSIYDSRNNCNAIIETASNMLIAGCQNTIIPDGITRIGERAFYNCTGLTDINIPESVTRIDVPAFDGTGWYNKQQDGLVYIGKIAYKYKGVMPTGSQITFKEGTIGIAGSAFYNSKSLAAVTIPSSVVEIGTDAFSYCSNLIKVTFHCKSIHKWFARENSIQMVIIGKEVKDIVSGAFPASATIYTYIDKSLLALWNAGYSNIKEIGTDNILSAPTLALSKVTASSVTLSVPNNYSKFNSSFVGYDKPLTITDGYATITGLDPNTQFDEMSLILSLEDVTYTTSPITVKTEDLTFKTLQPKVISEGNVIIAAQSNLDDEEVNVGFEWRRTDWSDDFDSKSGGAYLYDGMMEGYIRSLNSNYLWRFRPFYTSNAGNTYYGDWKGLDPSDYSYFEPTVHTYTTVSVQGNMAEVKGYVMRGTDNVTSQGFMYWITGTASSRRKANTVPADAKTVLASGNVMTARLEDLEYETQYCYVAFVTTSEGETFFGETQFFTTNVDPDGIGDVKAAEEEVTEIARYDLNGRKLSAPQKGINIIRYSDGTTKKVVLK